MEHRRPRTLVAVVAGLALAAVAGAAHSPATASTVPDDPAPLDHLVGRSPFGRIVTDPAGRSLYVFGNDSAGESTCFDGCATAWPPLLADPSLPGQAPELPGVDQALLSLVERPDGDIVAIAGLPLYYFAGDAAPGELNGHGVGGNWWLVTPDGTPIESIDPALGLSVESTEFGDVIVDQAGWSLYMFSPDAGGRSTCSDGCAAVWPPLFAEKLPVADGIEASLLSLVERPDGNVVAVAGWPLYYFVGDAAPGDVNGQGVEGIWWLLSPEGTPIELTEPLLGPVSDTTTPPA